MHKEDMLSPKKQKSPGSFQPGAEPKRKLDIVLKTDSSGTKEAIESAIKAVLTPQVELEVIQSDIWHVSQKYLFLAETASRLVIGFNVDILAKVKELAKEQQVEVRLYDVIYELLDDLKKTALSLLPKEEITGRAKVIALFSGGRKSLAEEENIPEHLKIVIYRISQESLNNITKHSHADKVRIRVTRHKEGLELLIEDNGSEFDAGEVLARTQGMGIGSMKERAHYSGGVFSLIADEGEEPRASARGFF